LDIVKERMRNRSSIQKRPAAQYDIAAAAEDWLSGMTFKEVRDKHHAGNSLAFRTALRKHIGSRAYDDECCARKSRAGKSAWGLSGGGIYEHLEGFNALAARLIRTPWGKPFEGDDYASV
jgi:hypothetical protein